MEGAACVWRVRPNIAQQYSLPEQLPQDLVRTCAFASTCRPCSAFALVCRRHIACGKSSMQRIRKPAALLQADRIRAAAGAVSQSTPDSIKPKKGKAAPPMDPADSDMDANSPEPRDGAQARYLFFTLSALSLSWLEKIQCCVADHQRAQSALLPCHTPCA